MDFLDSLQHFHLLRPYWLIGLFPLALLLWVYSRSHTQSRNWASVIDKRLLPHLLQTTNIATKSIPIKTLLCICTLLIIALAGPAFEKRPQPVFKVQSALVIILDLSLSMDATDIKPSRLSRAHFKINDILKLQKEGQTALITYAADAYVVSPLTDDANTIISQVPALETSIMPAQGSRLDIALLKAEELFKNSGLSQGHIFILSDSVNNNAIDVITDLNTNGFTTSVLAIGTEQGAPIATLNGGFVKDSSGAIVVPKLDSRAMRHAASQGGGRYSQLTASDKDINYLLSPVTANKDRSDKAQLDAEGNKLNTDLWHEEGPWLLLLVIPFAAYVFRKGLVFVLLLFVLPLPQPAQAANWSDFWNNKDQLGSRALQEGDVNKAAELFNNPEWKATAQYKAQNYQQAADTLSAVDTADSNYNRGNALAKAGKLDDAIQAYNRSLELDSNNEDAKHNLELIKQAQQQSDNKESDNSDSNDNKSDDNKSDDNNSDEQNSEQNQQGEENSNEQQQNDQQSSDKSSDQNSSESDKDSDQDSQSAQDEQEQNAESDSKSETDQSQNKEEQQDSSENKTASEETKTEENTDKDKQQKQNADSEPTHDLQQQQTQQWLKKIPDDPGALLRRKFKYQYGRDKQQSENNQW